MYLSLLSIGIGAALGAWLRWFFALKFNSIFQNIPLGTALVNFIGAFIIGFSGRSFLYDGVLTMSWRF